MTDAELVCGARAGNAEAWRALWERYLPLVWRYAYALLADVHAAEDVTSETMFALLKGIQELDADGVNASAWLRSVVRHKVADHQRSCVRSRDRLNRIAGASECSEHDPTRPVEVAETQTVVLEVLEQLPEPQRLALEWKYAEGQSVREIAGRMGQTEKSVEATLYRARREFRRRYEQIEAAAEHATLGPQVNPESQ